MHVGAVSHHSLDRSNTSNDSIKKKNTLTQSVPRVKATVDYGSSLGKTRLSLKFGCIIRDQTRAT